MGLVLGTSFLAVSFLAAHLHVVPVADESKSVLATIAEAVYGSGAFGHILFLVLQIGTTLILILAANTSFADFPRLASFHAGDAFMPRQLTKRGHRLVFSNGIVALAAAASLVLVAFGASVTRMIPLYALGVFTSFTLSQTGMAKRHLRLREQGWRFGLFINGLGAVATFVVAIVIAVVKFAGGAWMVMIAVPILVALLVRVNKTYASEDEQLAIGPQDRAPQPLSRSHHAAVLLIDGLDAETLHAAQYALTIAPTAASAVALGPPDAHLAAVWAAIGSRIPLRFVPCRGRAGDCVRAFIAATFSPDTQVTLIVPAPADEGLRARVRRGRTWAGLTERLRDVPNVGIVVVRDHGGAGHHVWDGRVQVLPRQRHVAIVLVEDLDRAVLKAAHYAYGIDAAIVRGVHAASDPDRAAVLIDRWISNGYLAGIPLDVEECNDRNIERSLLRYIGQFQRPDTEITLIMPRRHFHRRRHLLLHDRTSRRIARAFAHQAHVDVVIVPFHIGEPAKRHQPHDLPADQHYARPSAPAAG
jgi:hypothetical protein